MQLLLLLFGLAFDSLELDKANRFVLMFGRVCVRNPNQLRY